MTGRMGMRGQGGSVRGVMTSGPPTLDMTARVSKQYVS